MILTSRQQARALGSKRYYTGVLCLRGHVTERQVSSGTCMECDRVKARAYKLANRDKHRASVRAWRLANLEKKRSMDRAYQLANPQKVNANSRASKLRHPDKVRAYNSAWRLANQERRKAVNLAWRLINPEQRKAVTRAWKKANRGKVSAGSMKRIAAKLQRTPPWADLKAIEAIYEARPVGFHVDHFYPLQGRTVSGLHVHTNLQYLTQSENSRKGNRLEL